jgi:protein-S-isoprenylcysteine O-methyltransferase Ste14
MKSYSGPNIRVPPLYFVGGFLIGMIAHAVIKPIYISDIGVSTRALAWSGWIIFALGMFVAHTGLLTFILAGTPWLPFSPATKLVTHGFYKITRNPMYLGLTIGYIGGALVLNTAWPLIILPFVLWGMISTVIVKEEAYLEQTFGDEYREYKRRVRRWL